MSIYGNNKQHAVEKKKSYKLEPSKIEVKNISDNKTARQSITHESILISLILNISKRM